MCIFRMSQNNQTCREPFRSTSYGVVLGRGGKGQNIYIYETKVKPGQALIPTDWHDSGILAPNAAVLIAVFALRLSVGGWGGECHVCHVRWTGGEDGDGEGVSVSCQDEVFKCLTNALNVFPYLVFLLFSAVCFACYIYQLSVEYHETGRRNAYHI